MTMSDEKEGSLDVDTAYKNQETRLDKKAFLQEKSAGTREGNLTVLVWIQEGDRNRVCGMMVSPYQKKPVGFADAGEMVLKLDEMCSRVPGLDREWELRCLSPGTEGEQEEKSCYPYWNDFEGYPQRNQTKASLEVSVKRRMHGSLQGLVRGKVTGNRYIGFRSALELMRMVSTMKAEE